ncbi:MAG: universal stress protein [Bacteroidota bacterium]|nr:universal stress protein [Bacteroidota bacterium]
MRTIVVPVDFSETSLNAVTYAVKMFTGVYGANMILYHVYEKPEHKATAEQSLQKLRKDLFDTGIVKIQLLCEEGHDFAGCLEKCVHKNKPDMVIMGITGKNKAVQTVIGSNTLAMIKKNLCPVLIIPPGAQFVKLKKIALASDFIHAPSPVTVRTIKDMLSSFFASLHIVNVNPDHHVSITEDEQKMKDEIDELFKGFEHEFYFISMYDLQETMNLFAKDNDIDMIITMPKDHSWFDALKGGSNTKKMVYQSTIPVLAVQ